MTTALASSFLLPFACLADRCPDTCCKGWNMQVDQGTLERYATEAPELLPTVALDAGGSPVMRRDPLTNLCQRLDDGFCATHRDYGAAFLGDACYFFPRITRSLGEGVIQSATLSCPEIARLAMAAAPSGYGGHDLERLPQGMRQALPEGLAADDATAVHARFHALVEEAPTPERAMAWLVSLAHSLDRLPVASWGGAIAFYGKTVETRLPALESNPSDPFLLAQAVNGIANASPNSANLRLAATLGEITTALAMMRGVDGMLTHSEQSLDRFAALSARWQGHALATMLKRWLGAQLSMMLFPFAGLGAAPAERSRLLAFRFAATRLGLMALAIHHDDVPEDEAIRVIQSLSRLLDHLADPTFTLIIMEETGWNRESRLRAAIGDAA